MTEYTSIKDSCLKKFEDNLPEIRKRFGIETIGIFGSVSRGEDTETSDVDVLYMFREEDATLKNLLDLKDYLEDLFERNVDLVPIEFLTPRLKLRLQRDAILYGAQKVIA